MVLRRSFWGPSPHGGSVSEFQIYPVAGSLLRPRLCHAEGLLVSIVVLTFSCFIALVDEGSAAVAVGTRFGDIFYLLVERFRDCECQ